MSHITYTPPGSLTGFLTSESFVSLVSGPVGSGKSSAAMIKIAYHAKRMKAGADGVRRSRYVVVRNTAQMLTDATIPTFMTWFPDGVAGSFARTDKRFYLRFDDVECEVLFRGLDDANDVRRLLSLEVSGGVLDEFREIHPDIFNALQGRVGRFPSRQNGGCMTDDGEPNAQIWGATNAPDYDSFWAEYMMDPPKTASIFTQPSALSPEADWVENLMEGYYQNLAEGKTEDWVAVYIHNEFGKSLAGEPVFRAFNRESHLAKETLRPMASFDASTLLIGVDAGLTPAAVIGQVIFDGRLLIYDSLTSDGMGALRFIREKLKPLLAEKFPGARALVIIDPAAKQRAQTDERSVLDIYKEEGFQVQTARTNSVSARINAVDRLLTRTVDGKPGILFCPGNNKVLVSGLGGKYRYKINTKGERDEKPEKSHPVSDVVDALQYVCLHSEGGGQGDFVKGATRRDVAKVSSVGWT